LAKNLTAREELSLLGQFFRQAVAKDAGDDDDVSIFACCYALLDYKRARPLRRNLVPALSLELWKQLEIGSFESGRSE